MYHELNSFHQNRSFSVSDDENCLVLQTYVQYLYVIDYNVFQFYIKIVARFEGF